MLNLTEIVNSSKYSISGYNNNKLSFTTDIADSGCYTCVSSNYFKGKLFNSSTYIMLNVEEKNLDDHLSDMKSSCSKPSCSFIQSCVLRNGSALCSLNIWSIIAFLFIALTAISGAACVRLILSRNTRQNSNQTNGIG